MDPNSKSFFSEIISSIADVKFSPDGRYFLSRDYVSIKVGACLMHSPHRAVRKQAIYILFSFLKVWDINMESRPVQTLNVHDYLRPKLCDLYENDCIFDKFEASWSGDGSQVFPLSLFASVLLKQVSKINK